MGPMDDFERRLADEVRRQYGPPRSVDTMAVVRSVARIEHGAYPAPIGRVRSMFSMGKLVAAAAAVALTVGLVSSGILTTSPRDGTPLAAPTAEPSESLDWTGSNTFSGTSECMVTGFGDMAETASVFERRGYVTECHDRTSDPRTSGAKTVAWDNDCYAYIGCIGWGTFELVGPDGAWVGRFTMSTVGSGEEKADHTVAIGTGTGAYEGWTYIGFGHTTGDAASDTVDGFVYLGDPPPMPSLTVGTE